MAVFSFMNFIGQGLATFVSILLLLYTRDTALTRQTTFALLVYMAVIDMCWSWSVPLALSLTTNVSTSVKRIQAFLEIDEQSVLASEAFIETPLCNQSESSDCSGAVDDVASDFETTPLIKPSGNQSSSYDQPTDNLCLVSLYDVTCKLPTYHHGNGQSNSLISFVTLNIKERGLMVVIGPVGSGKSSLLSCILGNELHVSSGTVKHSGKLAYVSETPWVFPGTIRENILFGLAYNERLYSKTVDVCELRADFKMLTAGDMSLIGEHGSTVSGGQRTRIALARAVYSQADIYLLDDPLSALDANVANNIFRKCLRGLLANRIIILTTHHFRYLDETDWIVRLEHGVVMAQGDYTTMRNEVHGLKYAEENAEASSTEGSKSKFINFVEKTGEDEPLGEALREEKEDRETGSVQFKVYWEYLKHGLPGAVLLSIAVVFCLGQGGDMMSF